MKTMRQIPAFFLAIVMALSLAACGGSGGSETTVVLRGDMTDAMGGVPTTDTWTITANGDVVKTLKEVVEYDLSEFDSATQAEFDAMIEGLLVDPANAISGISCTSKMSGSTYTIELTVNCSGDTVKEAVAAGILTLEGDSSNDKLSLKLTQAALEKQGYEVVK